MDSNLMKKRKIKFVWHVLMNKFCKIKKEIFQFKVKIKKIKMT